LSDLAVSAEQPAGTVFFLWDHITRYWPTDVADAWVSLSAVAARTERIRLGALITPLPRAGHGK
jgi:alkanesulfonate monooxygenase SsuD/methylene tetrahydromethanopterin reductase-like flavin-dependent oxidoreductase (luciferase family)